MHGGGKDVFAHYVDTSGNGYRELIEGESVTFDVVGRPRRGTSSAADRGALRVSPRDREATGP
ncbi:cold shock domain-containing protein [Streptomyces fagopyri]|uniref:cold shock domain-containing protein n=1 Tax=Streptomyces fagopyri TaxID=2662397 RepID=UPI003693D14A